MCMVPLPWFPPRATVNLQVEANWVANWCCFPKLTVPSFKLHSLTQGHGHVGPIWILNVSSVKLSALRIVVRVGWLRCGGNRKGRTVVYVVEPSSQLSFVLIVESTWSAPKISKQIRYWAMQKMKLDSVEDGDYYVSTGDCN